MQWITRERPRIARFIDEDPGFLRAPIDEVMEFTARIGSVASTVNPRPRPSGHRNRIPPA